MKKTLIVLALVMSAQVASADMTLIPSSHPVYGDAAKGMDKVIIGYISNIDWDKAKAEADARNGQKLPVLVAGSTLTDEAGVVYTNPCSRAVSTFNCVDLTKTPKYREDMLSMARALIAMGAEASFPIFSGWFRLAK